MNGDGEHQDRAEFERLWSQAGANLRDRRKDFDSGKSHAVLYSQGRHDEINNQLRFLEAMRINAQERIEALEARLDGSMKYRGGFQRADEYKKGDAVTCDGSLWFCLKDVPGAEGKPGNQSVARHWQMTTRAMK
ncbi:hypothetical protein ACFOOP_10255 [Marinicaulis aureus]|uniref:Uncharacterized protein n=1 Tax=Hyphococcus aureus TaxID=2666033 RepID=A0ABW1L3K3_9PROT